MILKSRNLSRFLQLRQDPGAKTHGLSPPRQLQRDQSSYIESEVSPIVIE